MFAMHGRLVALLCLPLAVVKFVHTDEAIGSKKPSELYIAYGNSIYLERAGLIGNFSRNDGVDASASTSTAFKSNGPLRQEPRI